MRFTYTRSARRHRIGRTHVRAVLATAIAQPLLGVGRNGGALIAWVGADDRGVELEIVGERIEDDVVAIFHVMPRQYRVR